MQKELRRIAENPSSLHSREGPFAIGIVCGWLAIGFHGLFLAIAGWGEFKQCILPPKENAQYGEIVRSVKSFEVRLSVSVIILLDIALFSLMTVWLHGIRELFTTLWSSL